MEHRVHYIVCYTLALAVTIIMVRIEWLNAEAGGVLPMREYRNQDPSEGVVRWRTSTVTTEAAWRQYHGPRDSDYRPVQRPLTAAEVAQMETEFRQAKANNALLRFVEWAGLIQYPLVPVLVGYSILIMRRRGVRHGMAPLFVGILGGVCMVYWGYFTSLEL